ncbi:MAG: hypothetical protein J5858_00195, partial [Lentisphaeria bacterium]|nr:hypothetical protein [Lentisphaeria bacterium]
MPDNKTHSALTRAALQLQTTDTGDNTELIRDYCSWPDYYFSDRWKELEPYMFFLDGVQFHYPPDTPYSELYRYWKHDEKGFHRSRPFVNENFRHVTSGFAFYIERIIRNFRKNEMEEGKKYLGCLLHMLEDSTFGLHALEGAGGTDAFALDRMMDDSNQASAILAGLKYREDFPELHYIPRSLGNTPGEMVMKLYSAYCAASSDSRKCGFRFIMNTLENRPENNPEQETGMYANAVKLCADVIHTVFQLAGGEKNALPEPCRLNELEPYEFPLGGFGAYRFRSFIRNSALDRENNRIPLDLDCGRFEYGISFGSHYEGILRYWIAPNTFREFR